MVRVHAAPQVTSVASPMAFIYLVAKKNASNFPMNHQALLVVIDRRVTTIGKVSSPNPASRLRNDADIVENLLL